MEFDAVLLESKNSMKFLGIDHEMFGITNRMKSGD